MYHINVLLISSHEALKNKFFQMVLPCILLQFQYNVVIIKPEFIYVYSFCIGSVRVFILLYIHNVCLCFVLRGVIALRRANIIS